VRQTEKSINEFRSCEAPKDELAEEADFVHVIEHYEFNFKALFSL